MSVLVKGMDMPRHCGECGIDWCYIWRKLIRDETPIGTRPSDCPLVEVPDPDEDKAFRRGAEAAWEVARKIMTRGPYDGGFDCMELEEIFDYPDVSKDIGSILEKFDAITVMYKIADYERKKADATHDIH